MKRAISILSAALLCCTSVAGTTAFTSSAVDTIEETTSEYMYEFTKKADLYIRDSDVMGRYKEVNVNCKVFVDENGAITFAFSLPEDLTIPECQSADMQMFIDINYDVPVWYGWSSSDIYGQNKRYFPDLKKRVYNDEYFYDMSTPSSAFVFGQKTSMQWRFKHDIKIKSGSLIGTIEYAPKAIIYTDDLGNRFARYGEKYSLDGETIKIIIDEDTIIEKALGKDYVNPPVIYRLSDSKPVSTERKIEYAATEQSTPDTPVADGVALEGVKYLATMFPDDYAQPLEDYLHTATLKAERNGDTIKLFVIPDDTAKFNRCSWGAFVLPSGSAIANSSGISPELKESGFVNGERFFQIPMYTELGSTEDTYYGTAGFTTYDTDFKEGKTAYSVEILLPENCTANCFQAFGETFYLDTLEKAVEGDVNRDGKFNIADLVMFQNFLLGKTDDLPCWENANLCNNGVEVEPFFSGRNVSRLASHNMKANLDVFDLCLMRRKLVESAE